MPRATEILRQGKKALEDLQLLKLLQSEIKHELTNPLTFQNAEVGSLGDFKVEWDSPKSQDVLLRKKCEAGEELAVSAMLGDECFQKDVFPREASMKVCVKKTGLSSILQFDCSVYWADGDGSNFEIQNAYYLKSSTSFGPSFYKGPSFSTLDFDLQDELKEYLVARGVGVSLTNFLLLHLHKKEQGQYVNWLQKLEAMFAQSE